jgi:hypothetical protein
MGDIDDFATETPESHGFKTNYWCMLVGIEESEGRQKQRYVMKRKEATLSHGGDQDQYHFQSSCAAM